jgi:hypothetical protein
MYATHKSVLCSFTYNYMHKYMCMYLPKTKQDTQF